MNAHGKQRTAWNCIRLFKTDGQRNILVRLLTVAFALVLAVSSSAQTSWKGTVSTTWKTTGNWTAGIPSSTLDAIIGDTNFTGPFQPTISGSTAACKSLTLGNGAIASTLTVSKGFTVYGDVTIGTNGAINHTVTAAISVKGNWTNSGGYAGTRTGSGVTFSGTTQTIAGNSVTGFRKLTISATSATTLARNINVTNTLSVSGTLDPGTNVGFTIGGAGALSVASGGKLLVRAASFAGNVALTGTKTLSAGSTVDYTAAGDQSVTNALTYSTLRISGSGIKTLSGNLTALVSSSATVGNIDVSAGTFDLATFTANRGTSVAGGSISVAAGATLKIGGTGTMPANYATRTFNSVSTAEYYGTNQTVSAESYGTLILSSSGAAVKTMPATAMTLAGDFFARTNASGASVIFTNAAALTVNGHITLGAGTTFNGGAFSNTVGGNWTNNGTFAGNASSVTMNGVNTVLTGAGANNFFNLIIARSGVTADTNTSLTVAGDFSTTGPGTFTHTVGGTGAVTMSGAGKTIAGTGIVFSKLNITGTNSTSASFVVADDLTVSGSFSGSGGTVTLSGAAKKISGAGVISFGGLNVSGTVTTTNNYTVTGNLAITGSFTATSGTTTFGGATTFSGTASLFNMTLNGTLLRMSSESILRLAGVPTFTAGTFDVTNQRPSTVVYNATGNQSVSPTTYDNLEIATGGTKSAAGNMTVRGSFIIDAGAVFDGGSGNYTNSIRKDWLNYGTFTAGNSTVELQGGNDATLVGPTTFSKLRLNKDTSTVLVNLATNQSVATLDMTSGTMNTGSNTVTITTTRINNGIILGRITRTHAFGSGVAYAFEGPNNTISFLSLGTISSITVTVTPAPISSFPFGASVNRLYNISMTSSGAGYIAALRLHYEDTELNGNSESSLQLWRNSGSWVVSGKSANSTVDNWVEQGFLSDVTGPWALSLDNSVVRWNGSVSAAWENATNWTAVQGAPSLPPSSNDIVQLGTTNLTFQPTISSAASVKGISFGSARAITLTLGSGGSLQTAGNVAGVWTNNVTHTINVGTQTLNVGGDLALSDGTSGHVINLNASAGAVTVGASLTESGGANLTYTGAGTLNLGGDFNYVSGAFTAGASTVNYNGSGAQAIGAVTYNELVFNKPAGTASLSTNASVASNLTITNGSRLSLNADLSVAGNVTIRTNTTLVLGGRTVSVGGNWLCDGSLNISVGGVVLMNGSGAQSVGPTAFQYFDINKSSGTVALGGNISAASAVDLFNGTLDLGGYALSPGNLSAALSLSAGTKLRTADSFPTNFLTVTLNPTSTVEYYGASNQFVVPVTYGNLILTNGVAVPKTLGGATAVAGNLIIHSNATLAGSAYTLRLLGNWTNNGAFTPGTSTVILNGTNKTIAGNTTFNNMTIGGSYTMADNNIYITGNATILGSYVAGSGTNTIDGDLFNSGAMSSTGTTTFTGTRVQTIQLLTPIASVSSGVVNFNGTVSPVLNTTTSPQFANVNINNTGGVTASVGWTVFFGFRVGTGATFNGNVFTHTFYGTVTNNGTMTSSGTLNFSPLTATTLALGSFSSSGTVAFNGTSQITLSSSALSLGSVNIWNTHAAGITPVSNWTLAGDLTIGGGAVFHAGAGLTHTLVGSLDNDGTLDGGTGLIVFNGTSEIDGTGSTVFNHVRVSGSLTNYADIAVSGNFTNNGAFDASGVDVSFTGSGPSVIAGSTTPTMIDSLVIAKTAATTTLGVNVAGMTALTIASGTLDASTFTVTEDATDFGALTMNAGGTLKLGGSSAFPTFSTGVSLDPASTVEYYGSSAQTIAAQNYGNLTSSSTGARTLASTGSIGVAGAFSPGANSYTISGSTIDFNGTGAQSIPAFNYQNLTSSSTGIRFLTNSGTIGIAGTFTVSSNSFTVGGSTVNFNGAAQTVPAFTYGHVIVSGSNTKTLGGGITVGGNLTLSAGTLAASTFPIYLAGDWSNNSGASAFTGGSGTVVFNGTNLQAIAGSQFTAFNNVIVSNVVGASVTRSIKVTTGIVSSNALLMGVGPVGGAFTVNGTMTPGTNNISTLTVSNAPTFAGTFLAELNSTNAQTADKLTLTTGILTYGGALVVTNLGPMITNGTFTLFTATNYAGAFASLTFPVGGSNHWKTNNLIVNGTISFTNSNPVARSVATSVSQGGVVTVPFDLGKYKLATDADGDGLAISAAFGAANANVGVAANGLSMSYTNTSGSAGASDSFSYVVSDGIGGLATNVVTVRIEAATGFNMLSANGNTLSYFGIPGASYAIENTAVLSPANWVPVSTNVVGADGKLVFNLQSPSGFYRTRYVSGP